MFRCLLFNDYYAQLLIPLQQTKTENPLLFRVGSGINVQKEGHEHKRRTFDTKYTLFCIYYICIHTLNSRLVFPKLDRPQVVYGDYVASMLALSVCILISRRWKGYFPPC